MQTTATDQPGARFTPQLLMGLLIILIGILFTLDNLGMTVAERYIRYWPAGLIAVGVLKLWQSRGGSTFGALVAITVGTWLLLESLGLVFVHFWEMWPLLLVIFGASMVWQGLRGGRRQAATGDQNDTMSALAVLGGVNRGNNSRAFKGGDLTAVMGGCEIDLRQAAIEGEAVFDVFAMWGGIEIRVPDNWTVIGRVTPILGGFDDKTRPAPQPNPQRLVIRGFVIMGGVEVKN
jgi:predicted membrane protein